MILRRVRLRLLALLALGAAMAVCAPATAMQRVVGCPALVKAIDRSIHAPIIVEADFSTPPGYDPGPEPPSGLHVGFDVISDCRHRREDGHGGLRPVNFTTRAAVIRGSRHALARYDFFAENNALYFTTMLDDALEVERATGIDGPVTRMLRAKGRAAFTSGYLPLKEAFSFYESLEDGDVQGRTAALAGLCIAEPGAYKADATLVGITPASLARRPKEIRPIDQQWYADIYAETDRVLKECPL